MWYAPILCLFLASAPKVYYGSVEGAKKPAELIAKDVFNEIPEYKEIKDRGLTEDDAEYWILLEKANKKFKKAVKKVAEQKGYDVVVEKGTGGFQDPVPDITKEVIAAIEN